MTSAHVTISNPTGLHMRPAQLLVQAAGKHPCNISVIYGGKEINAKSIMQLMAACIKTSAVLEIRCEGENEAAALEEIKALVASGFGE